MMLTIHREEPKPRLVTMGQADKVIESPPAAVITGVERTAEYIAVEFTGAQREQPPEPFKVTRGRPKKMAKDKDLDSTAGGPEVIRKDDAATQGAIGSHGVNAPAQEKVPEKPAEGNKEGE
jgi:hypothetical protein